MRDRDGLVQVVVDPDTPEAFVTADKSRSEYVLKLQAACVVVMQAQKTPICLVVWIEVWAKTLSYLTPPKHRPFPLNDDFAHVGEEIRLKYRFLDMRRPEMLQRMRFARKRPPKFCNYLDKHGFWM